MMSRRRTRDCRFIERVSDGTSIKIIEAFASRIVKLKTGVGALGHAKDFADLALKVHELVEFHLLPMLDAQIIVVRVNGDKSNMGVTDGLEQEPLDGFAIEVEHFDFGINGRTAPGRVGFDNECLPDAGLKLEEVRVRRKRGWIRGPCCVFLLRQKHFGGQVRVTCG